MKTTILTVQTITIGMKAKKVLLRHDIKARIVKLDTSDSKAGCGYGLEFSEKNFYEAVRALRENQIPYGVYKKQ